MIDEVIKMKQNKNIVIIFCDETDSTTFLEGYIYAVGVQKFLIKHITPHGLADGYILKELDSIVHLETGGKYERKIEKLYHKKNQKHIDLEIDKNSDLEDNILQICMNNEYITSFEMVEDDECPIKGTIKELDSNKVIDRRRRRRWRGSVKKRKYRYDFFFGSRLRRYRNIKGCEQKFLIEEKNRYAK